MEHLPIWLRNVPLPARPATGEPPAEAETPEWLREPGGAASPTLPPTPADDSLDWLREPEALPSPVGPAHQADDTPDWLRSLESEVGVTATGDTFLPPAAPHDDTPDWLREAVEERPTPPARPAAEPFGATSWLQSLVGEEAKEEVPEPTPEPTTTTTSRIKMPVGATDWLRSIGQEEEPEPVEPKPTPSEMIDVKSGVPDWLRDVSPSEILETMASDAPVSEPIAASPEPPAPAPMFDPLASNWLTAESSEEEEVVEAPAIEPATPPSAVPNEQDGIPSWLLEAVPDSFDLPDLPDQEETPGWLKDDVTVSPQAALQGADVPDWLHSAVDESADAGPDWLREPELPATAPAPSAPIPDDVPDWLRGADAPTVAVQSPTDDVPDWLREPEPPATAPAPSAPIPDDVPDWLRGADAPTMAVPTPADDVPDWLREPEPPPAAAPAPSASSADDVPDWLRGADAPTMAVPTPADDVPDWLREPEPPAAAPAPSADIPDWLRGEAEAPTTAVPTPADDVPDWLREPEPPAAAPAPSADIPDWLRGEAEAPTTAAPAPDDVPDWLRGAEAPPPTFSGPAPSTDVPDWLRGEAEAPTTAAPAPDDVPDWLRQTEPPAAASAPSTDVPDWLRGEAEAPTTAAPPAEDIPDWLRQAEPPAAAPAPSTDVPDWLRQPEPSGAAAIPEDVPDWLRQPASPIPPSASDTSDSWLDKAPAPSNESDLPAWLSTDSDVAASDARGATSGDMSLPSWLRGVTDEPVAPPAAPRSPSSGDSTTSRRRRVNEDAEGDDFLKGTELPSWLRPIEPEPAQPSPERKALDWLTRLGGSEENENEGEGVSSLVPEPAAVALPARRIYERSPEQIEALALLERLVHSPYPAPVEAPLAAAPSRWQKIGLDRVLYMLFMLVLLIGMIVPAISTPFQTTTPSAPGAVALNEQLAQLSEDDVVLIAYEWNAQRASELRPLETAITSKLIAQRSKLILLSTNIQGTMLSFELRGPLRAAGYNIDPNGTVFGGRDYILLGYRPGGELALRRMAQNLRGELTSDFEGHDATPSLVATNFDDSPRISSLNDLAMIIVMADQPQDVQAWMEQIHSAAPAVPIAFLLPQETAPLVQPYLRLPNVYHLAGLPGALALQAQGEEVDTQMIAHMSGQQGLAIVTLVVLVIVSSLGVAIARARRTQRGAA